MPNVRFIREESDNKANTSSDLQSWGEGMEAFQQRDYDKAARVFDFLNKNAESADLRLRALYALACTRLVLAGTVDEINGAMAIWDSWARLSLPITNGEDPRMLMPFLERTVQYDNSKSDFSKALNSSEKVIYKNITASKDLTACKSLLQTRERELEHNKLKLQAKEKEVRQLKSQIDSLEAIHLKIQEKKKEISSP